MRHKSKTCSLEAKFPLLAIEQGCLISKDADITVAFRVELPELFTVTSAEYEEQRLAYRDYEVPMSDMLLQLGYMKALLSDKGKSIFIGLGLSTLWGYEELNEGYCS